MRTYRLKTRSIDGSFGLLNGADMLVNRLASMHLRDPRSSPEDRSKTNPTHDRHRSQLPRCAHAVPDASDTSLVTFRDAGRPRCCKLANEVYANSHRPPTELEWRQSHASTFSAAGVAVGLHARWSTSTVIFLPDHRNLGVQYRASHRNGIILQKAQ